MSGWGFGTYVGAGRGGWCHGRGAGIGAGGGYTTPAGYRIGNADGYGDGDDEACDESEFLGYGVGTGGGSGSGYGGCGYAGENCADGKGWARTHTEGRGMPHNPYLDMTADEERLAKAADKLANL